MRHILPRWAELGWSWAVAAEHHHQPFIATLWSQRRKHTSIAPHPNLQCRGATTTTWNIYNRYLHICMSKEDWVDTGITGHTQM